MDLGALITRAEQGDLPASEHSAINPSPGPGQTPAEEEATTSVHGSTKAALASDMMEALDTEAGSRDLSDSELRASRWKANLPGLLRGLNKTVRCLRVAYACRSRLQVSSPELSLNLSFDHLLLGSRGMTSSVPSAARQRVPAPIAAAAVAFTTDIKNAS